jgi:methylmalonyl-CoA mutase C-terminal domain/subunit
MTGAGTTRRPIRILLCKPGLDGHDRGVKVLARTCRDAGMEVIYGGVRQPIPEIAAAAMQEDVDVIGVSNHSGVLPELCADLVAEMERIGCPEIPIVAGGTLVGDEATRLGSSGIAAVFGPGSSLDEMTEKITEIAREHQDEQEI